MLNWLDLLAARCKGGGRPGAAGLLLVACCCHAAAAPGKEEGIQGVCAVARGSAVMAEGEKEDQAKRARPMGMENHHSLGLRAVARCLSLLHLLLLLPKERTEDPGCWWRRGPIQCCQEEQQHQLEQQVQHK